MGRQGAFFLTEPIDNHGWEWRCYMRDPDGYLIEVTNILKWPSTVSKTTPARLAKQLHSIRKPMVPLLPTVACSLCVY
jgi:hypothetical protein